jgi:hypothetical protein
MVPYDISDVSTFTMGGAPFVMNDVNTVWIDSIQYKIHESANTYNTGTTLTVIAS